MNELEIIAPMAVSIVLILTVGGVALLRPIAKRLGDLLEVMVKERRNPRFDELSQIRELLETTSQRLALLEQRQDFAESLLASREPRSIPAPPSFPSEEA